MGNALFILLIVFLAAATGLCCWADNEIKHHRH